MADGEDLIDRISDLPSNVIDTILSKLPINESARTSILSRKWRFMWNSVPTLNFGSRFSVGNYEFLTDIINHILLLHDGPVYKFKLVISDKYNMRMECLSKWILFLSKRGLQDLRLANRRSALCQIPSHIFSCQDLTRLYLEYFELSLPPTFHGFKSLTKFQLHEVIIESNALENLISGCPCLNDLALTQCSGFECINVSAPSLKDIWIRHDSDVMPVCLKNVKNLINLTLLVFDVFDELVADDIFENFERYRVSDLIEAVPKLERFHLTGSYIKIFSRETIPQTLKSSINSLKYLELDGVNFNETEDLLSIICLLESSPNLVELVIKSYSIASELHIGYLKEIECNSGCLSELRTVNIRVASVAKCALTLTRFLLKNASSLETLNFGVEVKDNLMSVAQELLRIERASQRAKVEFVIDPIELLV